MPIYEYRCDKCEREFEAEQRITDDPLRSCPHCRSRKLRRLISQTSFVLKGTGWYSDLYSSSNASKPAASDAGSDAAKPSESKPESADGKGPKDTKGPDSGGSSKKKSKSEPKAA
jgi:putative FmdB family regulatory protein